MANTLSDKTNKSIADIANKIMQEQPAQVRDFSDRKPIESDMVQRVMNLNVPNRFMKEEAEKETVHNIERTDTHVIIHSNKGNKVKFPKAELQGTSPKKGEDFAMYKEEVEQIDEVSKSHSDAYKAGHEAATKAWDAHINALKKTKSHEVKYKENPHRHSMGKEYNSWEKGHEQGKKVGQKKAEADPKYIAARDEQDKRHEKEHAEWSRKYNAAEKDFKAVQDKHLGRGNPSWRHYSEYSPAHVEDIRKLSQKHGKEHIHSFIDRMVPNRFQWPHWYDPHTREVKKAVKKTVTVYREEVEQIDESRFGRAIDPSKLSASARARLQARAEKEAKKTGKEAPKPATTTSAAKAKQAEKPAAPEKKSSMAALAASFSKPKAAAPADNETPAQRVRRQNMERQKDWYAKGGGHSGMNVGAGGRQSVTGHNTTTAKGISAAIKAQGKIKSSGLANVDEGLKGGQTKIDVAPPYGKLTAKDFKTLRAMHKKGN